VTMNQNIYVAHFKRWSL